MRCGRSERTPALTRRLLKRLTKSDPTDINSILTRWSIQRGVAVVVDEAMEDSEVEACCKAAKFRLNNAQKGVH